MDHSTVEITFNSDIKQDAYNRLVSFGAEYNGFSRIGHDHRGEIVSISFTNMENLRKYAVEDFGREFSVEYGEEIKLYYIPEYDTIRQSRGWEYADNGDLVQEFSLGWNFTD